MVTIGQNITKTIDKLMARCNEMGVYFNPEKMEIGKSEIVFFGNLLTQIYLPGTTNTFIVPDYYYSRFFEGSQLTSTIAQNVIQKLKSYVSRQGISSN